MFAAFLAAIAASSAQCPPIQLTIDKGDMPASFGTLLIQQTMANFTTAYARACEKGLLKGKALLPAESRNPGRIFLLNAPNANIASFYTADNGQTLLEYHFVSEDAQTYVPPADEIEEAIYCAVVGATEAEEEESGRCLPD